MQNAPSARYYYPPQMVVPPSNFARPPMCYPPLGPMPSLYAALPPTVGMVRPYGAAPQFTPSRLMPAFSGPCGYPPVAQYDLPPPPGVDDVTSDDTARLQEEFIRKCKYARRAASPPPFRRQRSRSRSTGRDSKIRGRKLISPPKFISRSNSYRRSRSRSRPRRSRESRECYIERSLPSSAFNEYNYSLTPWRNDLLDRLIFNNCSSSNEMSVQLDYPQAQNK